ncbi:Nif3-like dinuclear metal center hexameric protein [Sulfurimonas sp. SAG-AH-194-I05]|nr:Nif3-like dinuclear metal center hexameric protein [Sulfurimonas sp. SAG-AH-194-I05]MDF1874922.1 Nif3-like dinuclear metal center hexameric protein [Sulfurimonas sp. SAG-AH-194-I05]
MKLLDIYNFLNELSPFDIQEKWDNSGLLLGDFSQDIQKITVSIDVDEELIDALDNDTLLITHHPIIFSGLKKIQFNQYPSNLLQKMIQKNISNIAMHTNFDKTHLNDFVCEKVLGYKIVKKDGFIAYLEVNDSFSNFSQKVAELFKLDYIKSVQCHEHVQTVALVTGSGCSLLKEIDADCFLTGDIKYHDAMEAKSIGLSLIDIGHYESECFFGEILRNDLKILGLEAIIATSKNPFTYINRKGT